MAVAFINYHDRPDMAICKLYYPSNLVGSKNTIFSLLILVRIFYILLAFNIFRQQEKRGSGFGFLVSNAIRDIGNAIHFYFLYNSTERNVKT